MAKHDLNRQLVEMGRVEVVGPSRDFVDSLARRLDAIASTQPEYAPRLDPPRPRRPKRVILAPAFAALALVIGLVFIGLDDSSRAYALDDPFNVQVQLADGRLVDGTDGLKVSKGATIVVGTGGSVRIGDRRYHEGDVVVIGERGPEVADRVVVPAPTTRPEPMVSTTVEPARPSTTTPPTSARQPDTTAARPVESAPTTRMFVPETTLAPETTKPPATTRPLVSVELVAERVAPSSQVALSWSAVEGAAKYVVVRTVAVDGATPAEPVYPPVSPSKAIAHTTARAYIDVADAVEGALITAARYRVVALDAKANVIGSSRAVQVDLPR